MLAPDEIILSNEIILHNEIILSNEIINSISRGDGIVEEKV